MFFHAPFLFFMKEYPCYNNRFYQIGGSNMYKKILKMMLIFPLSLTCLCSKTKLSKPALYAVFSTSMGDFTVEFWKDKAPKTVENFVQLAEGKKEWVDPKSSSASKKPFYNGLIFHRIISNFMIQGGCPIGTGAGGPGYRFEDECYDNSGKILSGQIDAASENAVWEKVIRPYLADHEGKSPSTKINTAYAKILKANALEPLRSMTIEEVLKETGYKGKLRAQGKLIHPVAYGTICMANAGPNTNGSQFFVVTRKEGCSWLNGKHTVFGKVIDGMDVVHKIENVKKGEGDRPLKDVVIKKVEIKRL